MTTKTFYSAFSIILEKKWKMKRPLVFISYICTYLTHLMTICDNFLSATSFVISFSYYAWKEMKGEFWPSEGTVHKWRPVFFFDIFELSTLAYQIIRQDRIMCRMAFFSTYWSIPSFFENGFSIQDLHE